MMMSSFMREFLEVSRCLRHLLCKCCWFWMLSANFSPHHLLISGSESNRVPIKVQIYQLHLKSSPLMAACLCCSIWYSQPQHLCLQHDDAQQICASWLNKSSSTYTSQFSFLIGIFAMGIQSDQELYARTFLGTSPSKATVYSRYILGSRK